MRACPKCYELNADENKFCSECQAAMIVSEPGKVAPSVDTIAARQRYYDNAPKTKELSPQQWYNVCRFYPAIAAKAAEFTGRPLEEVGPEHPLNATAQRGFSSFVMPRAREPGEEG